MKVAYFYQLLSISIHYLFASGNLGECAWFHLSGRMILELFGDFELVPFQECSYVVKYLLILAS